MATTNPTPSGDDDQSNGNDLGPRDPEDTDTLNNGTESNVDPFHNPDDDYNSASSIDRVPREIKQSGMTWSQKLRLFDIKYLRIEKTLERIQRMLSEELNEFSFFRVQDEVKTQLNELALLDQDIRVHGDGNSTRFLTFLSQDVMGNLQARLNEALEHLEDKFGQEAGQKSSSNSDSVGGDIKLPRITIPTFNGNYTEWQTFYDLFTRLIHNNQKLSDAVKMQYLMSSLTGEANRLLSHFTSKAENYKLAWELLANKYRNKIVLSNVLLNLIKM